MLLTENSLVFHQVFGFGNEKWDSANHNGKQIEYTWVYLSPVACDLCQFVENETEIGIEMKHQWNAGLPYVIEQRGKRATLCRSQDFSRSDSTYNISNDFGCYVREKWGCSGKLFEDCWRWIRSDSTKDCKKAFEKLVSFKRPGIGRSWTGPKSGIEEMTFSSDLS